MIILVRECVDLRGFGCEYDCSAWWVCRCGGADCVVVGLVCRGLWDVALLLVLLLI